VITVVAFDPGISTGMAIYDGTTELTFTLSVAEVTTQEYLKILSESTPHYSTAIEFVPIPTPSKMNQTLLTVVSRLWVDFPKAEIFLPGTWKTSSIARLESSVPKNQHEKDALHIAMFYYDRLRRERNEEIS